MEHYITETAGWIVPSLSTLTAPKEVEEPAQHHATHPQVKAGPEGYHDHCYQKPLGGQGDQEQTYHFHPALIRNHPKVQSLLPQSYIWT